MRDVSDRRQRLLHSAHDRSMQSVDGMMEIARDVENVLRVIAAARGPRDDVVPRQLGSGSTPVPGTQPKVRLQPVHAAPLPLYASQG